MSGQQIGSTIGAIVGSYFGPVGQAVGAAIGGYIGGVLDPTEIFGPRLSDAMAQTARDGVPRSYGYGTFPTAGNLIWCSELKERKKTEGSKGSTTETITYHYYRSYAIAVCEGPAHGNGIAGYRIVKRNGKVVYDTRTDEELTSLGYTTNQIAETRAAQVKWLKKATFYYGVADQEPDPTIQAVKGADETPGYSYTAYMVVRNEELTETRGAVPQYEFIVSVCGDRTDDDDGFTPKSLLVTSSTASTDAYWSKAAARANPTFTGIDPETGADLSNAAIPARYGERFSVLTPSAVRHTLTDLNEWQEGTVNPPQSGVIHNHVGGRYGWLATTSNATLLKAQTLPNEYVPVDASTIRPEWGGVRMLRHTGGYYYLSIGGTLVRSFDLVDFELVYQRIGNETIVEFIDVFQITEGEMYACVCWGANFVTRRYQFRKSTNNGESFDELLIDSTASPRPLQIDIAGGEIIVLGGGGYFWTSQDGFSEPISYGLEGINDSSTNEGYLYTNGRQIATNDTFAFFLGQGTDNDKVAVYDATQNAMVGTFDVAINGATAIVCGDTLGTRYEPIPDAPGFYVDNWTGNIVGPGGTTISQCAPDLSEIVEDQCALRDVTTVDVSELDEPVLGFRIANTSSPQKNILAAQPGYFFDSSEFDGVLHFPKRGGEDSFHIPYADMCPREPDTIQWERTQEAELLRKVTFTYFDPLTTYTPTSQTGERRAGTIQAMGESASQLPMVGTGAWAAQAADINLKTAWAEPDECTFPVSLDWAELVTAAVGTIEDERGTIHRVRIEEIKDDGLMRIVKAKRTDPAAYRSNAAGKPVPLPTFPGSDLRGPTTWGLLNMPAVLDTHDRPGVYWGATGSFSAWAGAVLQVQRAGEWVTIAETVAGATVGTLAANLPFHAGDIDTINTLSLRINTTLSSVTFAQLLTERNPLAIAYDDGTAEVVQFQHAEIDTDGVWHCTTLLRHRLNTAAGLHADGARVVALDSSLQFVDLRPDDLGRTLIFRVVGVGTDPDTSTPFTMVFDRIWSSTEWEVAELNVERDGDDFALSWIPRHRLGTDVSPIRSANWDGYLVRWQHSDQFFEEVITETSKTYTLPGASDVTFTVAQLNRITGAGPETTVTIP